MSSTDAASRAAVPVSNARAESSRKNGAKSRGPNTAEGKARSARNALRHGMRAVKHIVLPDEDAVEFAALEAALVAELAPVGALQILLARRVAIAAWRLARADRMEVELFAERRWDNRGVGVALIRDGNGPRSFETLMRHRGAAMAEFMRALRTLKALQAEQAAPELAHGSFRSHQPACPPDRPKAAIVGRKDEGAGRGRAQAEHGLAVAAAMPIQTQLGGSAGCPIADRRLGPNEPGHAAVLRLEYVPPDPSEPGRVLHEPAASWKPSEPEAEHPARPNAPQASEHCDVAQPQ